ncbi:hypothetical protein FB548_3643 [Pseudoxanthomonas sp. 3HH-4]|nr:hypothetical protein FB548_3643 [Pseudoxanthomonas sp. 3HH-4]
MKVTFIPARDLKSKFEVLGHFYSLAVLGKEPVKCRSVLEIRTSDCSQYDLADAVFVMMNPGSSKPLSEQDYVVSLEGVAGLTDALVPTAPDTTQYQLMRVMHFMEWRVVRVINLSDLRDPQSASFVDRYTAFEEETGTTSHSVFSSDRSHQLARHLLRGSRAPIVCAWGVSNDLTPLICRAVTALAPHSRVTGLSKPGEEGKYFHPLPTLQHQKVIWVERMLATLQPHIPF